MSSHVIYDLLEKLEVAFPNKLPLESTLLNHPEKVWMDIGARRAIEFIRQELKKE